MQIKSGQRLHLVYEAGEGKSSDKLISAGRVSAPICGRGFSDQGGYKMTINMPLDNACKNCLRVNRARHS